MLTSGTIGIALGSPAWGFIHDPNGSYDPGFMVAPFVFAIAVALVFIALRGEAQVGNTR